MVFPPIDGPSHPPDWPDSAGSGEVLHAHGDGLCVWVSLDRSIARVHLAGELDLVSAPMLRAVLIPLSGYGHQRVQAPAGGTALLDMCELSFLDSVGINVLVAGRAALLRNGWQVCVARPAAHLCRLLDQAVQPGRMPPEDWWYVDIPRRPRR